MYSAKYISDVPRSDEKGFPLSLLRENGANTAENAIRMTIHEWYSRILLSGVENALFVWRL